MSEHLNVCGRNDSISISECAYMCAPGGRDHACVSCVHCPPPSLGVSACLGAPPLSGWMRAGVPCQERLLGGSAVGGEWSRGALPALGWAGLLRREQRDHLRERAELLLAQANGNSRDSSVLLGSTPVAGGLQPALPCQPRSPADAPPSMPTPWEASDT